MPIIYLSDIVEYKNTVEKGEFLMCKVLRQANEASCGTSVSLKNIKHIINSKLCDALVLESARN